MSNQKVADATNSMVRSCVDNDEDRLAVSIIGSRISTFIREDVVLERLQLMGYRRAKKILSVALAGILAGLEAGE